MAKPILIIRTDARHTGGATSEEIRENYLKWTHDEYHVVVIKTLGCAYYPVIEVHGIQEIEKSPVSG